MPGKMTMRTYSAFLCALSVVLPVVAIAEDAPQPDPVILLKAAHLFDARAGRLLDQQAVLIRGERIEKVAPASEISPPDGATVLDLGDATLLPGLIDCHVHLTSDPENAGLKGLSISVPREALTGAKNARRTLLAGFTTVRNVGASGYADVALRDAIEAREIPGPRVQASGPTLGSTGGHCDETYLAPQYGYRDPTVADGVPAVLLKTREVIKFGSDVIKFCASGGVFSKGDLPSTTQYSREEMEALVAEAHRQHRKVAAHAHGAEAILEAARAGVDSIEHGSLIDEEGIRLMKERGTYLVADIYNDDFILSEGKKRGFTDEMIAKEKSIGEKQRQGFRKAVQAGVKIAYGTDAGVYPHGDNGKQFAYMVKYGQMPAQALQAATVHAADLLGWPDRVGAIEPGKYADLIAVRGDPLKDITVLEHVAFVMKGSEIVKNDLMQ
jgi:imidazolonepropionase-like amidohydrolase